MLLDFGRWTCDSEPSSPTARVIREQGDNAPGGSDRLGQGRSDHRRTASSNDATPRPRAALPPTGHFLGLSRFISAVTVARPGPVY